MQLQFQAGVTIISADQPRFCKSFKKIRRTKTFYTPANVNGQRAAERTWRRARGI
jgi:hypothetical protein